MTRSNEKKSSEGLTLLPDHVARHPGTAGLPVLDILADLAGALASDRRALVEAPPGAGKTTIIPLALLHQADSAWLNAKKILVLEPRRLAARACAGRMAALMGQAPGQTVGYQVRLDRCVGPDTRIEVITEGILTRRIQRDPELSGIGLIIFDEFHERHLHSDLGLALALEAAEVFSPDLRLLVMSATMDLDGLSRIMGSARIIRSRGKSWPVDTVYLPPESTRPKGSQVPYPARDKGFSILPACRAAIVRALGENKGDILVFLPGAAQIRALAEDLAPLADKDPCLSIFPLFGNLSYKDQAAAIAPSSEGCRKLVLATPIAETSLTIEGVRTVVDTGLARVPKFFPGTGMSRLETLAVSRASADQRRGRAGRTGPGICYRLWSAHVHQGLIPFNRPEILQADLAPLVLELALWGVKDPRELSWLDTPPDSGIDPARALLKRLGALNARGQITDHGRRLAAAGIHPRLAQMVIRGAELGLGYTACCLAALVEGRDLIPASQDPDIRLRLEILASQAGKGRRPRDKAAQKILSQARLLAERFKISSAAIAIESSGRLLALAWPGRIAKKRQPGSLAYVMASGAGCEFMGENAVSGKDFIVAVHAGGRAKNPRISLAAPYDPADLEKDFSQQTQTRETVAWDVKTRSVRAMATCAYGKIILSQTPCPLPGPDQVVPALIQGIRQQGLEILPWSKPALSLCCRVTFLRGTGLPEFASLPDLSPKGLIAGLEEWLAPFLEGMASAADLKRLDLTGALKALLSWDQLSLVEAQAPTHIQVPSGSRIPLDYEDETGPLDSPVLAVRLQEMFGLTATPAVAKGRVPLTLHLLSPARRPVQITRDLSNFWRTTYAEVKKDLMGRYPKHYWPEDPLAAPPTKRAKPRKR